MDHLAAGRALYQAGQDVAVAHRVVALVAEQAGRRLAADRDGARKLRLRLGRLQMGLKMRCMVAVSPRRAASRPGLGVPSARR